MHAVPIFFESFVSLFVSWLLFLSRLLNISAISLLGGSQGSLPLLRRCLVVLDFMELTEVVRVIQSIKQLNAKENINEADRRSNLLHYNKSISSETLVGKMRKKRSRMLKKCVVAMRARKVKKIKFP